MQQVILFPDVAAVATTHLNANLSGTHVGTVVPNPRPTVFVLARRLGGVSRNKVTDEATIGVECWAATDAAAHDLAQRSRGLLHALEGSFVGSVWVYRVEDVAGPSDFPDPLSDNPRYVFTLSIAVRGTVETS